MEGPDGSMIETLYLLLRLTKIHTCLYYRIGNANMQWFHYLDVSIYVIAFDFALGEWLTTNNSEAPLLGILCWTAVGHICRVCMYLNKVWITGNSSLIFEKSDAYHAL